jgi:hypothetical protein
MLASRQHGGVLVRGFVLAHRSGREQLYWNGGVEPFFDPSQLKIKPSLDIGVVGTLNHAQHGLGVTSKSPSPRENFGVSIVCLLEPIYFVQLLSNNLTYKKNLNCLSP